MKQTKENSLIGKVMHALPAAMMACSIGSAQAMTLPAPIHDSPLSPQESSEKIVLGGGCFWGVQGVFQHLKGVKTAVSGYAGGTAETAKYNVVSNGTTGHAEVVEVTYDSAQITLGQILHVFFSVAHNPTELNFQGPDHGTQYRSVIFYSTPEQRDLVKKYIDQLNAAKAFDSPVVTTLEPLAQFYPAESYHQDYMKQNPLNPYIMIHDAPKIKALKKEFPALYEEK